jgi:hypothetical protein
MLECPFNPMVWSPLETVSMAEHQLVGQMEGKEEAGKAK